MNIAKIKRKIHIWMRKIKDVQPLIIHPEDAENLRFYQFKTTTADFFYSRLNKTDIRIKDTPHYHFAAALAANDAEKLAKAQDYYRSYIAASWQTQDEEKISKRINEFIEYFTLFKNEKIPARLPILTQFSEGGDLFIVDGNHRTAFSIALNKKIEAKKWPFDLAFLRFSYNSHFYGSGNKNIPYQSIYINKENILHGRREDAIERIKMLPLHVIQGASILDVASNLGMSSIIAKQMGAESCLGIEYTSDIVDYANRFAMFNGVYPDVQFKKFDLDKDQIDAQQHFTTAFMFSIHDHLKHPERLISIARDHVKKYVVFEGHPHGTRSNYANFLDSDMFKDVREIGTLKVSADDNRPHAKRILWLCEKH